MCGGGMGKIASELCDISREIYNNKQIYFFFLVFLYVNK